MSNGAVNASGCVGFRPISLHQDVEGHHHAGQMRPKTAPGQMSHHLAAPYCGHQGIRWFPLPSARSTLPVGRSWRWPGRPLFRPGAGLGTVKAGVGQDDHSPSQCSSRCRKVWSCGLVKNRGGSAVPTGDQAQLVDHDAELAPNNNVTPHPDAGPAVIGLAPPARLVEIVPGALRAVEDCQLTAYGNLVAFSKSFQTSAKGC